ncbi:molybdopterin guanine dinucleotide synthesis [bacterium]|nr:molybdopterin guanine dinucleotide synthesis [bacterium]
MRFDRVAVVDWSASSGRPILQPHADAIWLGLAAEAGVQTSYHPTRHSVGLAVDALIDEAHAAGQSLLVGFDFPMGYPDGFAARLTGEASARAVWRWLQDAILDGPDNCNNRFAVADAINARFGGGPFWGRPQSQPFADLPPRKTVDYARLGLAERRRVEEVVPRAQPVWKLYTTGAVGSQSLTGLPLIHRLSQRPGVAVWPFDPPGRITLAEIYPSLLAPQVAAALTPAAIKDEVQVRLLARALYRLGQSGDLGALLEAAPPEARREEGWILGAGAARLLQAAL